MGNRHTRRLIASVGATVLLAVPLAGCQQMAEKAVEEATGGNVDIKDGGKDITIKGPDGQEINVGSGAELPDDWPKDVPIPDGAKVVSSASASASGSGGGAGQNVSLEVSQSPSEFLDSFKASLESNGWEIVNESSSQDGGSVAGRKTGPDRNVVVFVTEGSGGKSVANLTVAEGQN